MSLTVRNLLLSLLLSLGLTFVGTVVYVFYPVLRLMVGGLFSRDAHTDGIAAVAGGVSEAVLGKVVLIASIFFVLIFALLQRRRAH